MDIQFGESKKEPLFSHMKRPLVSRPVTPGAPNALDGDELGFLRDLPGPRRTSDGEEEDPRDSRDRVMLAGDAVLAYWARTARREQDAGPAKIGQDPR